MRQSCVVQFVLTLTDFRAFICLLLFGIVLDAIQLYLYVDLVMIIGSTNRTLFTNNIHCYSASPGGNDSDIFRKLQEENTD